MYARAFSLIDSEICTLSIMHPGLLNDPNRSKECQGETSSWSRGSVRVTVSSRTISRCCETIASESQKKKLRGRVMRARGFANIERYASPNRSCKTDRSSTFFPLRLIDFFKRAKYRARCSISDRHSREQERKRGREEKGYTKRIANGNNLAVSVLAVFLYGEKKE